MAGAVCVVPQMGSAVFRLSYSSGVSSKMFLSDDDLERLQPGLLPGASLIGSCTRCAVALYSTVFLNYSMPTSLGPWRGHLWLARIKLLVERKAQPKENSSGGASAKTFLDFSRPCCDFPSSIRLLLIELCSRWGRFLPGFIRVLSVPWGCGYKINISTNYANCQ